MPRPRSPIVITAIAHLEQRPAGEEYRLILPTKDQEFVNGVESSLRLYFRKKGRKLRMRTFDNILVIRKEA